MRKGTYRVKTLTREQGEQVNIHQMVTIDKIKQEAESIIDTLNDLYLSGVNVCKGCKYEHFASCPNERVIAVCPDRIKAFTNQ